MTRIRGDPPRRIRRQTSYAALAQEFATQPYPRSNEVQTQQLRFRIIFGSGDASLADRDDCAEALISMLPAPGATAPEMNGIRTTQIRQSTYSSPRLLGGFFVHRAVAQHSGFTLVELVVVVMILGIIASIAAPRLLSTSDTALDNSLRQTLGVVRDAIDKFAAENTALPGADGSEASFKSDLMPYLRGSFPSCPVGDAANDVVRMQAGTGSIASGVAGTASTHAWAYKYETGDFHVNSTAVSNDGVATYDQF